ncbi:hypothetical protein F5050DRAFT_325669 [Lentinula boryana]|uniref:Uncharacterized protein n=1 Tax=Lentinula boryana TaxID=40481 RepID=A0ABQ8QA02_9AGAR|nr:hypothetical protein F5050DRAFT_325669 [Lentinula boryana]
MMVIRLEYTLLPIPNIMHRRNDRIRSPSVVGSRLPLPLPHPPRPLTNPPQLPTKLATWRRDFLVPTIRSQLHPYKIKSEAIRDRDLVNAQANFNSRRREIERIVGSVVEFNTTREMEFGFMSDWTPPDDIDISFDSPEWYDDDSDVQQDFFDQDRIKAVVSVTPRLTNLQKREHGSGLINRINNRQNISINKKPNSSNDNSNFKPNNNY